MTAATTWAVERRVPDDADLEAAGETRTIEDREDRAILAAARSAGIWLSADCQQGWCITGGARLLEGEVDHSRAKRYYPQFDEAPFALFFVERGAERIWAGRAAASELCHRAGMPVLVQDVVGENYERFADAIRFVSGVDREIDPSHDDYP